MWRRGFLSAMPVLASLVLGLAPPAADASDIRDNAGLFSRDAIARGEQELDRIERQSKIPVRIETVKSHEGQSLSDFTRERFRTFGDRGLLVLISQKEHQISFWGTKSLEGRFTKAHQEDIRTAISREFKKENYDAGLTAGIKSIETTVKSPSIAGIFATPPARAPGAAHAPAPAARASSGWGLGNWLMLGLGIFLVLMIFRALGGLFSGGGAARNLGPGAGPGGAPMAGGPGYGGPAYGGGGGGGGFFSGMLGGLGGALAGNWLYDQFRGHGSSETYGSHAGMTDAGYSAPPADAPGGSDAWGDAGSSGGADWGGGGGGGADWGGGGGGGDWGGGDTGGGDW